MVNMASMRLDEIVAALGGELLGDGATLIRRVATLYSAGPGDLVFLSQPRYRPLLQSTRASAVILPPSEKCVTNLPRIICKDPYLYFAQVAQMFNPPEQGTPGIHQGAFIESDAIIDPTAQVGAGAYVGHSTKIDAHTVIGPGCFIGNASVVGKNCRLYANVTIYHGCTLGSRAIIHSGAVIGADGFGMAQKDGIWVKIPQTGRVIIGEDVEIGANTTIDRGALDDTVIEDGVKLDNQIQIGHNVHIGAHSALAGCVGIAGSTRIGRRCTLGGGAIVLGHLEIADDVHISAATLITKSITKAGSYAGAYPFGERLKWMRSAAALRHLDELVKRVAILESKLSASPMRSEAIKPVVKDSSSRKRLVVSKKARKG
jgi:UDP-3-O-[3-hydroxymyristoyl] glucosamine N-acyltransferase